MKNCTFPDSNLRNSIQNIQYLYEELYVSR